MSSVETELQRRLAQLGPDERQKVLAFVRSLAGDRPRGTPGSALRPLFGCMTEEDVRQIREAIEEGCERIEGEE